ncbi:MAG TPA: ABC transporter permease [Candidatus Limnocylindrales bacterium]|nr:ABC transporter permease [Candidatus Limnocylindrales bacterium]
MTIQPAQALEPGVPSEAARRRRSLPDEAGVIVALVALVAVVGALRPTFLQPSTLFQQLSGAAFIGMLALGMVFVVAVRDIDLSVGWTFNFAAVVAAKSMVGGLDPWLGAIVAVGFGALLGLVNGVLAVRLRIPVIIITLGTFSAFRGLSLVLNESRAVVPPQKEHLFFTLIQVKLLGLVPMVAVAFVLLAVALHALLHHTRFGYRVQALGSNPDAARLAGIPVDRTRIQVLVLMGALAGLTGALFLGFRQAIDPVTGGDYLLPVVAAVIIGGTPLSGGRGTIVGAVIGALIIQVITTGILFLGVDVKWSTFVTGAVIVIAVAVDQLVRRQRERRQRTAIDAL